MALPAHVTERIERIRLAGHGGELMGKVALGSNEESEPTLVLPVGIEAVDAVLPERGLPRGAVVELAVHGAASLATTLALRACQSAQQLAVLKGGEPAWCAFVDASETLFAPGVEQSGVVLERLLVARPPMAALARTALRFAESHAFAVVVIDLLGVPGAGLDVSLGGLARVVRRLAMAAEASGSSVLLLTDAAAPRPLPLPVAMRLELSRPNPMQLGVRVGKHKHGRVSPLRLVAWPGASWDGPRAAHVRLSKVQPKAGHAA